MTHPRDRFSLNLTRLCILALVVYLGSEFLGMVLPSFIHFIKILVY